MTKLFLITISLLLAKITLGQKDDTKTFYSNLQQDIKTINSNDSIKITITPIHFFTSSWTASIKKIDTLLRVTTYSEKVLPETGSLERRNTLDTSFLVTEPYILNELKEEKKAVNKIPFIKEATHIYLIEFNGNKKEFRLARGGRLYYRFRYNKPSSLIIKSK
jgi:hypothetical protein